MFDKGRSSSYEPCAATTTHRTSNFSQEKLMCVRKGNERYIFTLPLSFRPSANI
jgi:hypothetical protein